MTPLVLASLLSASIVQDLPPAETLLDRHEALLGAPELRARVRGVVFRGTVAIGGAPASTGQASPTFEELHLTDSAGVQRVLHTLTYPGWGVTTQGTDGTVSWSTDPGFGVAVKEGAEQGPALRLWGIWRSAPWRSLYGSATTVGLAERDGRKVVDVAMQPHDGDGEHWFLDAETAELVAVSLGMPDPTGGTESTIPMEFVLSDWKSVGGVRYPHRRVQRVTMANRAGGSDAVMEIAYAITAVEQPASLDVARLAPPADVAAAIQDRSKRTPTPPDAPEECALESVDSRPIAAVRLVIPADQVSQNLARLLPEVMGAMSEQGVQPAGPPFSRYHRIDAAKNEIDLEAGIPVKTPFQSAGRVKAGELPGGRVARTWHIGPYHELARSYARLEAWLKAQGLTSRGGFWEVYVTDPGIETDPAKWKTQIFWPVE